MPAGKTHTTFTVECYLQHFQLSKTVFYSYGNEAWKKFHQYRLIIKTLKLGTYNELYLSRKRELVTSCGTEFCLWQDNELLRFCYLIKKKGLRI